MSGEYYSLPPEVIDLSEPYNDLNTLEVMPGISPAERVQNFLEDRIAELSQSDRERLAVLVCAENKSDGLTESLLDLVKDDGARALHEILISVAGTNTQMNDLSDFGWQVGYKTNGEILM